MSASYTYRDMTGLTKFLTTLLWIGAALGAVAVLSSALEFELLTRENISQAEAEANDTRQQIVGLVQVAVYLLTVVIFARWIYRANQNVRAIGAQGLRITPGWAVGYFFVPVICLWRPYQAMKDLWRASQNPASWVGVAPGSILGLWWTLWIASNVLGQMTFRTMMHAQEIEGLKFATIVQILSDAVDIPLCIVALTLVAQVVRGQNAYVVAPKQAPAEQG